MTRREKKPIYSWDPQHGQMPQNCMHTLAEARACHTTCTHVSNPSMSPLRMRLLFKAAPAQQVMAVQLRGAYSEGATGSAGSTNADGVSAVASASAGGSASSSDAEGVSALASSSAGSSDAEGVSALASSSAGSSDADGVSALASSSAGSSDADGVSAAGLGSAAGAGAGAATSPCAAASAATSSAAKQLDGKLTLPVTFGENTCCVLMTGYLQTTGRASTMCLPTTGWRHTKKCLLYGNSVLT